MTRGLANTAPGDPGSIARLATAAGVVQRRLAALDPPKPPVTDDLPRRLDRVHRELDRQRCSLDRARTTAAAELGTVGEALRTHADELSTTHASLRAVLDRAAARGLVLEDRHLRPEPGIRGTVDVQHEVDLDDELSLLEAQLQSLIRDAARRRTRLEDVLRGSMTRVAEESARLRRG
jgi:hypothetical protein